MNSYYDPLAVVYHLVRTIGQRPATTLAEAQAAAYVDGRLRHAGLSVSADSFQAPRTNGITLLLLTLIATAAALLSLWFPLLSALLACCLLLLTVVDTLVAPLLTVAPVATSQNIVGIRPCEQHIPRWRVVLVAALDTPNDSRAEQWANGGRGEIIGRWAALALIALFAILYWSQGAMWWWYGQILPVLGLGVLFIPRSSPGAASAGNAGAMAAMLSAAEQLHTVQMVEVWAVALGATSTSDNGIRDLLHRYPFTQADTLFLVLENIVPGTLHCATREGILGQYPADDLLLHLTKQVQTENPAIGAGIAIEPSMTAKSLALPLYHRGFRVLSIHTKERFTLQEGEDRAELFHPQVLHDAGHLLVNMVNRLDLDRETT